MPSSPPQSLPGVADVEVLSGAAAAAEASPDLLVEVPHGADRRDYDALRAQLGGPLPADLHDFFFVNTDVGAWEYGRRVAERVVAADPTRSALLVRCRIPRTFIDCNRIEEATEGDLAKGGMTASVPAYIHDAIDHAMLLGLHRRYVAVVELAQAALAPRGFMLLPHTYGPRTLGIEHIGDDIVDKLRWAHEPGRVETWPLRPEVDLITADADGHKLCAEGVVREVAAAYRALGIDVRENATYHLHPSSLGHRFASLRPTRTLCLEVRRDRLVREWTWNRESVVDPEAADRFAAPIAAAIDGWLRLA